MDRRAMPHHQSEINEKRGTKFAFPVVYYSQLMSVAYGGAAPSKPVWTGTSSSRRSCRTSQE